MIEDKTNKPKHSQNSGHKITVIGSGEAFSSQFGNTSYLLQTSNNINLLFDCGYQVPERLWRDSYDKNLDGVCFTHFHADHSFGILPLLVRYWEEGRIKPVSLLGPKGIQNFVERLFHLGYPGMMNRLNYKIEFIELEPGKKTQWKEMTLSCAMTRHSVLNLTIRLDINLTRHVAFAISGDGEMTNETMSLVRDVDILLQEIYTETPEIPGHGDLETAKKFISSSQIKRIGVAHHVRHHEAMITAHIKKISNCDARWFSVYPGLSIDI